MKKRISFKTRRPDLSRRAFRDHYEGRHVPLGLSFREHFQWRRYVRNHVLDVRHGAPVGFDCYAEFWVDDDADETALARFVQSPDFRVLDEDDHRFLDVGKRCSFDLTEHPIVPTRTGATPSTKYAVIWLGAPESRAEEEEAAGALVAALGDRVVEAVLDRAIGETPANAPFDRLLSLWLADEAPLEPDGWAPPAARWSLLALDPIETPRAVLEGASPP